MNTSLLVGQAVTGLVAGGGYAITAIGLSYTLGLARVMNFAFGTFYMLAAFATVFFAGRFGLSYGMSSIAAVAVIAVAAWVFSRVVVLPGLKISEPTVMIATLGAGVALTNVAQAAFGADVSFVSSPLLDTSIRLGAASVTEQSLLILASAPVLAMSLSAFMRKTLTGRRILAVMEGPQLAAASGLPAVRIQALASTIGIVLAAVAAVLTAPVGVISVFIGDDILLKAFAITALAGIGRIWGALVMGLGVGVFEALVSGFVSSAYATAAIYGLLICILVVFPRGLFRGH